MWDFRSGVFAFWFWGLGAWVSGAQEQEQKSVLAIRQVLMKADAPPDFFGDGLGPSILDDHNCMSSHTVLSAIRVAACKVVLLSYRLCSRHPGLFLSQKLPRPPSLSVEALAVAQIFAYEPWLMQLTRTLAQNNV